jgi:hypothetical protein
MERSCKDPRRLVLDTRADSQTVSREVSNEWECRWHNQLDPNIKSEPWSAEEEQQLFDLHNQYGNRWAKISELLPGR